MSGHIWGTVGFLHSSGREVGRMSGVGQVEWSGVVQVVQVE